MKQNDNKDRGKMQKKICVLALRAWIVTCEQVSASAECWYIEIEAFCETEWENEK